MTFQAQPRYTSGAVPGSTVDPSSLEEEDGGSFLPSSEFVGKWLISQAVNLATKTPAGSGSLMVRTVVEKTNKYTGVHHGALGIGFSRTPESMLWSLASSLSSYQQSGGAKGTLVRPARKGELQAHRRFKNIDAIPAGSRVTKPAWKITSKHAYGGTKSGYHHCKKGWVLVRVGDTNMCWKPPRRK